MRRLTTLYMSLKRHDRLFERNIPIERTSSIIKMIVEFLMSACEYARDSNVEECRGMTGDELTKHLSFLRLIEGGIVQHAGPCPLRVNRHIERQLVNIAYFNS